MPFKVIALFSPYFFSAVSLLLTSSGGIAAQENKRCPEEETEY